MNFESLHQEVISARDLDKRKELENDAKFRAVEQKVESYEQFSDIVKGCHLKPLDKKESLSKLSRSSPDWNYSGRSKHNETALSLEIHKYFPLRK